MLIVPLNVVPSQSTSFQVDGGQTCGIVLRTRSTGLFMDVYLANATVIQGVVCQNANVIVRDAYRGFPGDLAFFDTQPDSVTGPADPYYQGFGGRFILAYLEPADLTTYGLT